MMKSCLKYILFGGLIFSAPAYSQEVAAPAPAEPIAAPAPVPAAQAPVQGNFPALPPSDPCKQQNVLGYWKLVAVYEQPSGAETRSFAVEPYQFIRFSKDTTYRPVKFSQRVDKKTFFEKFERKEGDALQQFVVNETGFVYFYNEGNVVDTQACFIVAKEFGSFKPGQLLMMPPAPQAGQVASTRLLKVYYNITPKPKAAGKK